MRLPALKKKSTEEPPVRYPVCPAPQDAGPHSLRKTSAWPLLHLLHLAEVELNPRQGGGRVPYAGAFQPDVGGDSHHRNDENQ